MAHANARLTQHGRKLLVDRVLAGHKPGEVGKQLGVSRPTVYKWVRRYLAEGLAGLADRSSRPHTLARLTPEAVVASIVSLRLALHAGPVRLAAELGLPASTVGAVLRREQLPRLAELDRITGELIRSVRHSQAATSTASRAACCTSTSRSSAVSPTAAAGGSTAGRSPARPSTAPHWAGTTSTSRSTTAPGSPTPRSSPTRRARAARSSCTAPSPGSATVASPSAGCSPTTP